MQLRRRWNSFGSRYWYDFEPDDVYSNAVRILTLLTSAEKASSQGRHVAAAMLWKWGYRRYNFDCRKTAEYLEVRLVESLYCMFTWGFPEHLAEALFGPGNPWDHLLGFLIPRLSQADCDRARLTFHWLNQGKSATREIFARRSIPVKAINLLANGVK